MAEYTELIKALRFETDYVSVEKTMQDAAAAIEAMEAKVPHWVSVKDELPDTPRMVIAYVDQWHIFAAYHSSRGEWKQADGFTVIGVTHWMPIEPPKEVQL